MKWCWNMNKNFDENNMMLYFDQFKQLFKANCFSRWSGIKSIARIVLSIECDDWVCIKKLLEKNIKKFPSKQYKYLTEEEMDEFLLKTPEPEFLNHKFALELCREAGFVFLSFSLYIYIYFFFVVVVLETFKGIL